MRKGWFFGLLVMLLFVGCQRQETAVETALTEGAETSAAEMSEEETEEDGGEHVGESDADQALTDLSELHAPSLTAKEYPRVDGSTATIPLSQALYRAVTGASAEEAESAVTHSKTTNAYHNLIWGMTDLVIAYEPSAAVYELMEEKQVKLQMKPIGRDALVFLVNSGNPVETVTSEELVDIYSGDVTNWKELGGRDQELVAFQRPENSGSQTLMEKLVMKDVSMMEAPISRKIGEMGELIEAVASYDHSDNAIGYSVYYYARNMYQMPELRFLAVDGVAPSNDTIQKGTYPFVNDFYAVIREEEPEDSPARRLFSWLTEEGGQRLIEWTGYVPVVEMGSSEVQQQVSQTAGNSYLKEQERLIVDGNFLDGISRLVVFDGRFQEVLADDRYRPDDFWQVCETTEPFLLETLSSDGWGKRGLYCIEEDRWFLEPEYDVLWKQPDAEDGTWIWWGEKDEIPYTVSWKKGSETVEVWERDTDWGLGDCFWHEMDRGVYEIRDEGGTAVNHVDLSVYGRKEGQTVIQEYVIFYGVREDGSSWEACFDSRGNVLLDPEFMKQEHMAYITFASPAWGWVQGKRLLEDGSVSEADFVYSVREQCFLTKPQDVVFSDQWEVGRYFRIRREGISMVLDEKGEPVCSQDGRLCTDLAGDGYFGIRNEETMEIVKGAGGPVIGELPCLSGQSVSHKFGVVFGVGDNGWSGSFYRGEELLLESGYAYPSEQRYILHGTETCDKTVMVLDEEGNTLYQSEIGEDIGIAFDTFMVVYRGNYWNLIDYEGNVLLKGLQGYLQDD